MARAKVKLTFTADQLKRAAELDRRVLEEIGKLIVEQIVFMARGEQARSLPSGRRGKLPKLSKSYLSFRNQEVHFRRLPDGRIIPIEGADPDYRLNASKTKASPPAGRSNLTYSGELLDSLDFMIDDTRDEIVISFQGTHKYAKIKNDQLFKYLKEKNSGYNILGVDDKIRRQVLDRLRNYMARKLRELR